MLLSFSAVSLIGCNGPKQDEPIWEHVKITDLAPPQGNQQGIGLLLNSMNFNIYIFEMPAENIDKLHGIRQMLDTEPIRFNNYDAFTANSFFAGFGQVRLWGKIDEVLQGAGAKKIDKVTLLLFDGQADDLTVAQLYEQQTVFYISKRGAMEGASIGPGTVALRMRAQRIPGSRGTCRISVKPVFLSPKTAFAGRLDVSEDSRNFFFRSCGFGVRMRRGDLVFLGPNKYTSDQLTLDSLFFTSAKAKPMVRIFLLVCTSINY